MSRRRYVFDCMVAGMAVPLIALFAAVDVWAIDMVLKVMGS